MHTRRQQWIGCGCSLVGLAVLIGFAAMLVGPYGFVVVGIVALLAFSALAAYHLHRWRVAAEFRRIYGSQGKDVLIVYSDSPHWGAYIDANWLPRWGERAVMFNRSRPWRGEQIEARLWHAFAGNAEHTPVAIVVPRLGRPRVVRFWHAFRERKHGDDATLRAAEERLDQILSES
jgi:hypothetical protein